METSSFTTCSRNSSSRQGCVSNGRQTHSGGEGPGPRARLSTGGRLHEPVAPHCSRPCNSRRSSLHTKTYHTCLSNCPTRCFRGRLAMWVGNTYDPVSSTSVCTPRSLSASASTPPPTPEPTTTTSHTRSASRAGAKNVRDTTPTSASGRAVDGSNTTAPPGAPPPSSPGSAAVKVRGSPPGGGGVTTRLGPSCHTRRSRTNLNSTRSPGAGRGSRNSQAALSPR